LAKVDLEKLEQNQVRLTIEVDAAAVDAALEKSFQQVARRVNIPGFRRGKAPRAIVERYVGKGTILEGALDVLLAPSYRKALDEVQIEPIAQPDVDIVEFEAGKPLRYTATVTVKPEVALGQYTGLGIPREVRAVSDEDVDKQIEMLRERFAQLIPAPEGTALANGHFAVIDFEGTVDGTPFPGGKADNYVLEIGSGTFVPGFEEQLIGMHANEARDIEVTFPADYRAQELAGKQVRFAVKVKEIKVKELPEVNDDFVKGLGNFQTVEELRQTIKNNLTQLAEDEAREKQISEAVNRVVDASQVEIPEILVERRLDTMVDDVSHRMQLQGFSLEQYFESTGKTMADLRSELREQAMRAVKRDLVLAAIAKKEGLIAEDADVEREIARMAEAYGRQPADIRKMFSDESNLDALKESIRIQKAIDFILEHN